MPKLSSTCRNLLLAALCTTCAFPLAYAQTPPANRAEASYVPQRVFQSDGKRFTDFEAMLAELARAEVIFIGEIHDDPATHRLELAILEGLARRRPNLIVSLEMFERDVQSQLDEYLAGKSSEQDFLKSARPWSNYAKDYRPLVELARTLGWHVLAANAPRRLASQVGKAGLSGLAALPAADRSLIARQISNPRDEYFTRFSQQMREHPGAASNGNAASAPASKAQTKEEEALTERFYLSQCVKDETMAESIADAYTATSATPPLIVHFNGAFHSDYRLGTAARVRQRLPKSKVKVISVIPVENLDAITPDEHRKRADYLLFTLKPAKKDKRN